jgi:glycosyltransferase involved in cell wall biosynthesis/O-antigen/teichoic acid export membrane protein
LHAWFVFCGNNKHSQEHSVGIKENVLSGGQANCHLGNPDNVGSSLQHNFAYVAIANIVNALCLWGILVSIARLGSVELLGQFSFGMALSVPAIMFFNLQLRSILATDSLNTYPFGIYFTLRIITVLVALACVAIATRVMDISTGKASVIMLIATAKGAEAISDVIQGLFLQYSKMNLLAFSRISHGLTALAAIAITLLLTKNLVFACMSMAAGWLLVLLIIDLPLARKIHIQSNKPFMLLQFDFAALRNLSRLALPLGFVMLLVSLNANIPRYFVDGYLGEEKLGIFAALLYLVVAANQIAIALWQTVSPRLAKLYNAEDFSGFNRLFFKMVSLAIAFGLLGILFAVLAGEYVLGFAYGQEYKNYTDVLVVLMSAATFLYLSSLCGHSLTVVRKLDEQIPLGLFFVCVTGLSCWLLIPDFGLLGVAWAVFIAAVVQVPPKLWLLNKATNRAKNLNSEPTKVIHVLGSLGRGGVEMRLVEVMKYLDPKEVKLDFCSLSGQVGVLDSEVIKLGGRIHHLGLSLKFPFKFIALLKKQKYNAVHSHVFLFSGYILFLAMIAGIPIRIIHFRSTHDGQNLSSRRKLQRSVGRWLASISATRVLGVSEATLTSGWGKSHKDDSRCVVVYNGFTNDESNQAYKKNSIPEINITGSGPLIVHVGRFTPAKNHLRLLEIFSEYLKTNQDATLLLVGRGETPEESLSIERASQPDLFNRVIFTGLRTDVRKILGAADLLLFPSLWEGLPGVVIEALLEKTPVLASDLPGVREIDARSEGISLLSLEENNSVWANKMNETIAKQAKISLDPGEPFNLETNISTLKKLWGTAN